MKHSEIKALRKFVGGGTALQGRRQALGLSPSKSPRGGLRQGKEVTPYGK